ncbi:hypothetical protein [Streptomyces sp. NBC_00658]|uniref:hypothetical protein n=1 Tax=Streptomyces sp. NBC_00658 TaxID=2975800 RepID=UPI003255DBD3
MTVDAANDWQRLWLHTGDALGLRLERAPDGGTAQARWRGIPLSDDLAAASAVLDRLYRAYSLNPVTPGVMVLALLARPDFGAARLILEEDGLTHGELLEIVQSDLLDLRLERLDETLAECAAPPGMEGSEDEVSSLLFAAEMGARAMGRTADELDLIAALAGHPATAEVMEGLGITKSAVDTLAEPLRALGVRQVADISPKSTNAAPDAPPTGLDLLVALADRPSPGLEWLLKALGIDTSDLRIEALDSLDARIHSRRRSARGVVVFNLVNVILGLVASGLVIAHAIGPGSLWGLLLLPLVWQGTPRWPSSVTAAVAVVLFFLVTPWTGAVQIAHAGSSWVSTRLERRQLASRTAVFPSFAVWSRYTLRRMAKGRRSLSMRRTYHLWRTTPRILEAVRERSRVRAVQP